MTLKPEGNNSSNKSNRKEGFDVVHIEKVMKHGYALTLPKKQPSQDYLLLTRKNKHKKWKGVSRYTRKLPAMKEIYRLLNSENVEVKVQVVG